ncbi:GNAT family N-acetyltransferase [Flavobacterium sp. LS2P90]|uniref:GNAT family N-acetyltransferase n=1 Tax=Flavobacterium xylosi TaxID=3230415 RepID=A0ABW6HSH6_9FLAO
MQNIKEITAKETFSVRHPVLRAGKPKETCHFDGDNFESTVHFGLFLEQELKGVISLFKNITDLFAENIQYQIKGMAVLENYRKKGLIEALILHCEKYCITRNANLIWFNARKDAVGFYQKMAYQKKGMPFEIENIGEHVVMFKNL